MEHKGLSAALRLIDTDDFLGPENECIKPVKIDKSSGNVSSIEIGPNETYTQVNSDGTRVPLEKTKIELADCLACSGCVTSAEAVLVNEQSVEEFLSIVDSKQHTVVVSMSPQARAAIATHYEVSLSEAHCRTIGFLKHVLGADYVFDTSWGRMFTLRETCIEFVDRFKCSNGDQKESLPLISGVCPGWVCYAEKSAHDALHLISQVRSPQQMMGKIVPRLLSSSQSNLPLYHVAVMPCYDKKLEASREDFKFRESDREIDCVLTTGELTQILESRGGATSRTSFFKLPTADPETPITDSQPLDSQGRLSWGVSGQLTGSGGYLETVFRYAAKELFSVDVGKVPLKQGRNPDLHEAELVVDGKVVLRMAAAYGFRNIQNVLRKLRRGRRRYDFVEVMACPGGCVNGGGQLEPAKGVKGKDHLNAVSALYHDDNQTNMETDVWNETGIGAVYRCLRREDLYTEYHGREKIAINPLSIKW